MHLYHLTLQKPGAIAKAIFGNFSAKGAQEFVAARGHSLDLLRPDSAGQVQCVSSTHVFGMCHAGSAVFEFSHVLLCMCVSPCFVLSYCPVVANAYANANIHVDGMPPSLCLILHAFFGLLPR